MGGVRTVGNRWEPSRATASQSRVTALSSCTNEPWPGLPVAVSREAPLVFRAYDPAAPLVPDAFGIPSPGPDAEELTPDLVIAPTMAFDRTGARLGQGAGHYDRTLENLREGGGVFVLGLAYAGQEVARAPAEPHDQRLDAILTETGYIEVRKD